ncbi:MULTISPECIES: hypothetical protein [Allobranchiibius]|uniref:Uncharacterized protein n=1 Tax=Allobranchiibius huperziae TaxID=1874116 RepID=A0A853DBU5_9MICO|nr:MULTISPECIES: hypothetical protein [Allobranchiibius]MBO1766883.1 hypothetical protein [Allobranchiibius sp. GilTou38]NYJ75046.1 hypothetical protein [Allobranchiibius huperziae]UIJ33599.1 hypothetical protein LVQ62_10495 [Allobranchiibius sp. GilTou73]
MHIECRSCPARDRHCADCMVTVLLQMPVPRTDAHDADADLAPDEQERRGLEVLVAAGLVSPADAYAARAVREPGRALRVTG